MFRTQDVERRADLRSHRFRRVVVVEEDPAVLAVVLPPLFPFPLEEDVELQDPPLAAAVECQVRV